MNYAKVGLYFKFHLEVLKADLLSELRRRLKRMSEVSPFWRRVRELMHEIAVELYTQDHRHLDIFVKPEISELREGGYLKRARVYALRKVTLEEPGTPTFKKLPRRARVSLDRWLSDKPVREKKDE